MKIFMDSDQNLYFNIIYYNIHYGKRFLILLIIINHISGFQKKTFFSSTVIVDLFYNCYLI